MLKKRLLKNQKGLSAVVSTLIIILLVLVAAGIIWVVVRGIIQEGAEGIELGKFTLDLEIKSAQIENGDVTVVVVRRNPGEGNYIGMNFIFSDGTNSEIVRKDIILEELEERSFTFALTEIDTENLETISVAPIFELSSGKESVGNVADSFEVTEEMKAGIMGGVISNFEALGFEGAGTREYTISSQSEKVVKFTKVVVDPVDVLPGDNQTFTAYVSSPNGITNVTTVTELDNSTLNLDLELKGDDSWSATWIVYDTHTTTYRTVFTAWDTLGNSDSVGLTWTDSCQSQITHGALSYISTNCTTGDSQIGGIDGANLIINADRAITIDADSFFAFNQGKSITITASGAKIIATSGGSFGNSNLYYYDGDGDGYAPNTTLKLTSSGGTRAMSITGTSDCGDGNENAWAWGYGYDGDNDNYGLSSYGCNNGPANYDATAGQDCCDTDSRAHPGQTTYYTTPTTTCNDYDYNCNTVDEKQWGSSYEGGQCWECYWEVEGICGLSIEGDTGWTSSAPACGSSGTYIDDAGDSCASRSGDQEACLEECYMADMGPRTQACR